MKPSKKLEVDVHAIADDVDNILAPIVEKGTKLGYTGNKLQCYIKNEFRNRITELLAAEELKDTV